MPKLDLLLINPSDRSHTYGNLAVSMAAVEPPLWTALIAGFIREQGFTVKIIDADAQGLSPQETAERIFEYDPLLIGIGALGANPSAASTPKMIAVRAVLETLSQKKNLAKTVLYGIHPTALPEKTLQEEKADFVCRGESFYTILELLKVLKSNTNVQEYFIKGLCYRKDGQIVVNGWGKLVDNLDSLPFAAWDLLPMEKYRAHNWHCFDRINERSPYAVLYTSLGCPFHCVYCNIHALYDGKAGIRFRAPEKVAEEVDVLVKKYNVRNIKILDELFVLNENRVHRLCDLIIQRGYQLNIWAYARVDTVNEKILEKMKAAGINWLAFGIESANKDVRENVDKKITHEVIEKAVTMTHRAGIHIVANFIFGLPSDTMQSMHETLNLAKKLNCEYTNFYVAMAYPGSVLYTECVQKGVRLPKSWDGYSQLSKETIPLATKFLSSEEVLRFRDDAFTEYYSSIQYQKMIRDTFGDQTLEHIKKMLEYKVKRNILMPTKVNQ